MTALPLPERPSIVVLPFINTSGNPAEEYFADGISEDLVTGLARIRWLFVIARNSAFVYKGRAVDVKQVSRELGVRYVLEGSVRRTSKRLRITAQLVDATTGRHHWAEHYDREIGDMFAVQDEITRSVAAAVEPRLLVAEGIRALAPAHLDAWELVAQAQTQFWRLSRVDCEAAIKPLRYAVGAHPDYAPAHGRLDFAWCSPRIWAAPGQQMHAAGARARGQSDRARRLRSLGPYPVSLLGDDGTAHRRRPRRVPPRGEPQSQLRRRTLASQPRLRLCGAIKRRSSMARKPSG